MADKTEKNDPNQNKKKKKSDSAQISIKKKTTTKQITENKMKNDKNDDNNNNVSKINKQKKENVIINKKKENDIINQKKENEKTKKVKNTINSNSSKKKIVSKPNMTSLNSSKNKTESNSKQIKNNIRTKPTKKRIFSNSNDENDYKNDLSRLKRSSSYHGPNDSFTQAELLGSALWSGLDAHYKVALLAFIKNRKDFDRVLNYGDSEEGKAKANAVYAYATLIHANREKNQKLLDNKCKPISSMNELEKIVTQILFKNSDERYRALDVRANESPYSHLCRQSLEKYASEPRKKDISAINNFLVLSNANKNQVFDSNSKTMIQQAFGIYGGTGCGKSSFLDYIINKESKKKQKDGCLIDNVNNYIFIGIGFNDNTEVLLTERTENLPITLITIRLVYKYLVGGQKRASDILLDEFGKFNEEFKKYCMTDEQCNSIIKLIMDEIRNVGNKQLVFILDDVSCVYGTRDTIAPFKKVIYDLKTAYKEWIHIIYSTTSYDTSQPVVYSDNKRTFAHKIAGINLGDFIYNYLTKDEEIDLPTPGSKHYKYWKYLVSSLGLHTRSYAALCFALTEEDVGSSLVNDLKLGNILQVFHTFYMKWKKFERCKEILLFTERRLDDFYVLMAHFFLGAAIQFKQNTDEKQENDNSNNATDIILDNDVVDGFIQSSVFYDFKSGQKVLSMSPLILYFISKYYVELNRDVNNVELYYKFPLSSQIYSFFHCCLQLNNAKGFPASSYILYFRYWSILTLKNLNSFDLFPKITKLSYFLNINSDKDRPNYDPSIIYEANENQMIPMVNQEDTVFISYDQELSEDNEIFNNETSKKMLIEHTTKLPFSLQRFKKKVWGSYDLDFFDFMLKLKVMSQGVYQPVYIFIQCGPLLNEYKETEDSTSKGNELITAALEFEHFMRCIPDSPLKDDNFYYFSCNALTAKDTKTRFMFPIHSFLTKWGGGLAQIIEVYLRIPDQH